MRNRPFFMFLWAGLIAAIQLSLRRTFQGPFFIGSGIPVPIPRYSSPLLITFRYITGKRHEQAMQPACLMLRLDVVSALAGVVT